MTIPNNNTYHVADRFYVVGMGGHAKVVLEAAYERYFDKAVGVYVVDGLNTYPENGVWENTNVFNINKLEAKPNMFIIASGDSKTREEWTNKMLSMGHILTTLIHPSARVSSKSELGDGTFVARGASINPGVKTGWGCIINTNAVVDHDCDIGEYSHIAPGVTLTGRVNVGKRSCVYAGATVIPKITIGDDATVGAGAVVTKDVKNGDTVVGIPAVSVKRRRRQKFPKQPRF